MGRPKLLLRCGESTVLQCVIAAVRAAGVEEIVVTVAPAADELARLARSSGAHVVQLVQDTPDMRATCQFAVDWIEARYQPDAKDSWLLLPADHPTVRSDVILALLRARQAHDDKSIFVPTFQGRRGHPTLLGWTHAAGIRSLPADQGLNSYIRRHGDTTLEMDWPNDEILRDLDTPEDYERLLREES
jgi:molybdenum cofactor cytidylyltransferase